VGRQWLGRYGKTDSGVVTITTVWADERLYYPVRAVPYTPARHFGKGKNDPAFRTKLQIDAELAVRARDAGFAFRAVAADCAYGDQDGSTVNSPGPGCRMSWRSSHAAAPGPTARRRTRPSMQPAPWPGTARVILAAGAQ
jgi:SRSO17 transposase